MPQEILQRVGCFIRVQVIISPQSNYRCTLRPQNQLGS